MKKGDFAALCREPPIYMHLSSHLAPAAPSGVHPTASRDSLRFGPASICLPAAAAAAACGDEGSALVRHLPCHSPLLHPLRDPCRRSRQRGPGCAQGVHPVCSGRFLKQIGCHTAGTWSRRFMPLGRIKCGAVTTHNGCGTRARLCSSSVPPGPCLSLMISVLPSHTSWRTQASCCSSSLPPVPWLSFKTKFPQLNTWHRTQASWC